MAKFDVKLPRPRDRLALADNPQYAHYRAQVLEFLYKKQKHAAWYLRNERLAAWNISDPAVIDWQPTERVKILLCPGEEKWIFAQLWNGDGEFDHYQVRFNAGDWEDVPKTNTRDWSGRFHGWGLDRFSVDAKPGGSSSRYRRGP